MIVVVGYLTTRLIISSVFGIAAAQGAPSHFAVLLAVSLGVGLGWYFFARRRPISQPV